MFFQRMQGDDTITFQQTGFECFIDLMIYQKKVLILADLFFISKKIHEYILLRTGPLNEFINDAIRCKIQNPKYIGKQTKRACAYAMKSRKFIFVDFFLSTFSEINYGVDVRLSCKLCLHLKTQERYEEIDHSLYNLIFLKKDVLKLNKEEFTEDDAACRLLSDISTLHKCNDIINLFIEILKDYNYTLNDPKLKEAIMRLKPTAEAFESMRIVLDDNNQISTHDIYLLRNWANFDLFKFCIETCKYTPFDGILVSITHFSNFTLEEKKELHNIICKRFPTYRESS